MKSEYFKVCLLFNLLLQTSDDDYASELHEELIRSVNKLFLRYEVVYEPQFYSEKIDSRQLIKSAAVINGDFETAAQVRSEISTYKKKETLSKTMFSGKDAPYCSVDNNGYIVFYLNSRAHLFLLNRIKKIFNAQRYP